MSKRAGRGTVKAPRRLSLPLSGGPATTPGATVNFRLPNGLEVVLEENRAAPVVAFQAWVKIGSADEPREQAGIAHFTEHMLFKGTGRRGVGQIAQEVEGAGGEINAWTSYDETAYHLVMASPFFDAGLDILADSLRHSAFDPEELERERQVVLEEIKQGQDDPDRMAAQGLFQIAFDQHPYGRPIIGSPETVRALTRDQLFGFFKQRYVASNVTLVVVGDVDAGRARTAIEHAFGDMPGGPQPGPRPQQPQQGGPRVRAIARDVKECQLLAGFHVPAVDHEDIPALDLLAVVLGQGESSRLNLQLVRNRQLVTSASAYTFANRNPGLFVVGAALPPGRLEAATRVLLDETLRLGRQEVSAEEIAKSKNLLESERVFDKETVQGYARKLGFFTAIAGDSKFEDRYFQRLSAVGPAQLRQVAERYLRVAELSLFAQVPEPDPARHEQRSDALTARLRAVVEQAERPAARPRPAASPALPAVVRKQLPGGLTVLVLRDPSVAIVALRAAWVGGLRYESARDNGISNMVASLLTRGTPGRSAEQIMHGVEGMAGSLSGFAGRNSLGIQAEFLARHLPEGLDLVADCLLNATFPQPEIDRERRVVLEDIRAQDDNLTHVAFRAFHEAVWTRHPYRLDPLGTARSVRALDRRQLLAFYRRHYRPEALTLAVVGDVDPADVLARVARLFERPAGRKRRSSGAGASARNRAGTRTPAAEPAVTAPRRVVRHLSREQAHLVVGFPGVTLDSRDRFALELLSQVLSGQGGRLFSEIREKRGLAYRVSAFSLEGLDPGYFAVYVSASPDNVDEVLARVRDELTRLSRDGVTADELARAQRYLTGSHAIGLQRKSALAAALAFHEAYGQGWRTYRQYADQIGRVTVAQVQRAAQKYLRPQREVVALVTPQRRQPP
jgi:zinc protease